MPSDRILEIDDSNFEQEVLGSETPILLDFWAAWCGPCRAVAPVIDELAEEMQGKVRFGKVNVDDNRELGERFQIASIPTFLLFDGGEVKGRMMGAMGKSSFQKFLEEHTAGVESRVG